MELTRTFPDNIRVDFKGQMKHDALLDFVKKSSFDLLSMLVEVKEYQCLSWKLCRLVFQLSLLTLAEHLKLSIAI